MTKPQCVVCQREIPYARTPPYCSDKCRVSVTGYTPNYAKRKGLPVYPEANATTSWRPADLDKELEIVTPRLLVLSDVHCPIHSAQWLAQAVQVGIDLKCRDVLINGDFIDANQISRHIGSYYRRKSELADDFDAAESVLKMLFKHFDRVFLDCGNHDMRMISRMSGEVSVDRMWKMLGSFPNLITTSRSYVVVNKKILVVHPRQYKQARGVLPAEIAQLEQMHVVTGHQHHSAVSASKDGRWMAVDVGCIADLELQDYVRYEKNTMPKPMNGFAVIIGENILNFNKFTMWEPYEAYATSLTKSKG